MDMRWCELYCDFEDKSDAWKDAQPLACCGVNCAVTKRTTWIPAGVYNLCLWDSARHRGFYLEYIIIFISFSMCMNLSMYACCKGLVI